MRFPSVYLSYMIICILTGCGGRTDSVLNSPRDSVALAYQIYGDSDADTTAVYRYLRRQAAHGQARAFFELGQYQASLNRGDSALVYYNRAIELGDTSAYAWAGMIHLRGLYGQPQNLGEYVRLMGAAGDKGVESAAEQLERFVSDLEIAAASGNREAQVHLESLKASGHL